MTFIVAFEEEFCGELHSIFYVNKDEQGTHGSSVTTSEGCPHCGERYIYKVFNEKGYREEGGYAIEIYDCKCPNCRKEFDLEVEFEI